MTFAIALKVGDGVVLGADSAATIMAGGGAANVYFNAEKVFNLVKGLPIGVVVAGLGGLAGRSITSLARDLRERIRKHSDWMLPADSYTIEQATDLLRRYFFEELYCPEFSGLPEPDRPTMSLLVAGYSANAPHSEVWAIEVEAGGKCATPSCIYRQTDIGAVWRGQPEFVNRVINGYSPAIYERLIEVGVSPTDASAILGGVKNPYTMIHPAMPLQDAIDLVHYLVDATAGFVRFTPGPPTVHPPIDSAAVTQHEGFRWVRRKHYFPPELNRPIDRHPV